MKDFSLISEENFKGINKGKSFQKKEKSRNEGFLFNFQLNFQRNSYRGKSIQKMRNPGMKDFSLISNEISKRIHIEENPSKNEKSWN